MDTAKKLFLISALLCRASSGSPIAIKDAPAPVEGVQPVAGRALPPIRPGNIVIIDQDTASVGFNQPAAVAAACTLTLDRPPWKCPTWDGTLTVHTSAVIRTTSVDCKGCDYVDANDIHFCPNMQVTATRIETTASTFWTTVCARSTTKALAAGPALAEITPDTNAVRARMPNAEPAPAPITAAPTPTARVESRQGGVVVLHPGDPAGPGEPGGPGGLVPAACPTTLVIKPEQSAGKTRITHARYTTTTVLVPCGGCPLVVTTALLGYGPPGAFTKTTTSPMGTKTSYACL